MAPKEAGVKFQTPCQKDQKDGGEQQPQKHINNYVIDYNRHIGNGNFSHVYAAFDQRQPNNKLAVKVVNAKMLR